MVYMWVKASRLVKSATFFFSLPDLGFSLSNAESSVRNEGCVKENRTFEITEELIVEITVRLVGLAIRAQRAMYESPAEIKNKIDFLQATCSSG